MCRSGRALLIYLASHDDWDLMRNQIIHNRSSTMTLHEIEQYYFLRLYAIDFDSTLHSLRILRRYRRKDVRYCILRELVVSYARPFSKNKGLHIPKHEMGKDVVPTELRTLHDELVILRQEQFAHTDYTYRKPKVANWSSPGRRWFPMSFRGYDYSSLDKRVA
jgi:hypothetical protein